MGGPSRGGAGEWRAAPALVMGAATTPQGQEEQELRGGDCYLLEWDLRVARLGHNFVGLVHSTFCWAGYLLGGLAGWASFCWEPKFGMLHGMYMAHPDLKTG
jgi:hypothetical protein